MRCFGTFFKLVLLLDTYMMPSPVWRGDSGHVQLGPDLTLALHLIVFSNEFYQVYKSSFPFSICWGNSDRQ